MCSLLQKLDQKNNMNHENYLLYKLSNVEGFGDKTINIILERIKEKEQTLEDFFSLEEKDFQILFPELGGGRLKQASYHALSNFDDNRLEKGYGDLLEQGVKIITCFDKEYPKFISEKYDNSPPPILYCKGNTSLFNTIGVAIVGSRDTEKFGLDVTKKIAQYLSENGYNIVSGHAKGVDTSAHLGALGCEGTTTAILSSGINQMPEKNGIKEAYGWGNNLLFVSQFKPNEPWSARSAMIRNKLVCALSSAVIVISSGPEKDSKGRMSGSFDAGKTALKFGLPLLILSPNLFPSKPEGSSQLIKMGGIEIIDYKKIDELIKSKNKKKKTQTKLF